MVVLAGALMTGCSRQAPAPSFDSLAEDFVYGTLALSPVSATQAGYHRHKGIQLDEMLDDYSAQGMRGQRQFYMDFRGRLENCQTASLAPEQPADFQIVRDQIAASLLD